MRTVLIVAMMLAFTGTIRAQLSRDELPDASGGARPPQFPGSSNPAEELRYKAAVRQEEENHKETVERADEIVEIGTEVLKSFESNKSLSRDALKKLERMEKLARKVRSSAGGSDSENVLSDPPAQLRAALTKLSDLSDQLNQCVKKTSRMVVSATVIEHSNELILLIRHMRSFVQP